MALSTKKVGEGIIGPKHMIAKLVAVLLIGVAVALVAYKPMYRVGAEFTFVPTNQYKLVAPERGTIQGLATVTDPETGQTRPIKPGDEVDEGQKLVWFDTSELEKQKRAALSSEESQRQQARNYERDGKKAEAGVAEAEADRYRAEADLAQARIDKLVLRVPTVSKDGQPKRRFVILSGDLADRRGGAVDPNQELLTLAERGDPMEVELNVKETDIQNVRKGQLGSIATNSLPGDGFDVVVRRIVPMGNPDPKAADNTFKVYATVTGPGQESWRPGMKGEARLDVEPRPLYWIISHKLVDYVKLKTWF
jgi:multidrug efflux pump subunit AcrA (membrane-fusion protein)